jgi:hypothetical protein
MAMAKSNQNYIHVAVYYCGELIGHSIEPFYRKRSVTAGRGTFCNIKSPIWPKWDDLEILVKNASGLFLNSAIPWDGVISDGSATKILNSTSTTKSLFEISNQTSASLRLENLSIAIKIGPKLPTQNQNIHQLIGFRDSFHKFFARNSTEWATLGIGLLASGILCLSSWISLKQRPLDIVQSLDELPDDVLLPFISQKHLAEAPHVIQSGLDRFNYIHSVWNYYLSLANVIGFGQEISGNAQIFDSTAAEYSSLKRDQVHFFQELIEGKAKLKGRSIGIPAVKGETIDGKIQRILDKASIVSENSLYLSKLRNEVAVDFLKDIGYKYEEQKSQNTTNEAYAKISAGFLGLDSDDDMQKSQAKNTAAHAALIQLSLFGESRLSFGTVNCCAPPVGVPASMASIDWTENKINFSNSTDLAILKASSWGTPSIKTDHIKEPISGHLEPKSIEIAINAGRHQLRLCYEMALRRNQAAFGTMEWSWTIDTRGQIGEIGLIHSSIKDQELIECIHDKISKWTFPKPRGGSVQVRYPFEFSRDKG